MKTAQITTVEEEGRGRNEKSCGLEFPQCPPSHRAMGELVRWGRQSRSSNLFPFIQHQCCLSPLITRDASMWKSVHSTQTPLPLPFNDLKGKTRREIRHIHL